MEDMHTNVRVQRVNCCVLWTSIEVGFVSLLVQLEIALTMAEDGVEEGMLLSLRIKCMNASMTIFYEDIFSRIRLCRFFNFSCLCSKGKATRETLTFDRKLDCRCPFRSYSILSRVSLKAEYWRSTSDLLQPSRVWVSS